MQVRVYNDNKIDHVENFKGQSFNIPAGGYIEMEREDAVLFRGQFFPPKFNKSGIQEIESMKMIRIQPIVEQAEESKLEKKEQSKKTELVCMKCGFEAKSKAGLSAHIRSNHTASMVDDDAKEALIKEL